ncbi:hypothetical protein KI387_033270, partial [Taxus chinensis]
YDKIVRRRGDEDDTNDMKENQRWKGGEDKKENHAKAICDEDIRDIEKGEGNMKRKYQQRDARRNTSTIIRGYKREKGGRENG